MFTGLVVERGRVVEARSIAGTEQSGLALRIELSGGLAERLEIGSSLAVDGCCLTITRLEQGSKSRRDSEQPRIGEHWIGEVELSAETLLKTKFGELASVSASSSDLDWQVNLEPALELGQALGGHWVQGHVDCTTELLEREDEGDFSTFWWRLPAGFEASFVLKGSVTMDGVSLTVSALRGDRFSVALIPHTLEVTTLGGLQPGAVSNVEVDILSKYVERVLTSRLEELEERLLLKLGSKAG